jgi:hypothetical protein
MKSLQWYSIAFIALLLALYYTVQLKEEFIDKYCNEHRTCKDCSRTVGCAWCGDAKKCIQKSAVGNDPKCSADTAIIDSLNCVDTNGKEDAEKTQLEDRNGVEAYNEMTQKPQPPMIFTNPEMQYSPETVMANIGKIGADMTALQRDLPEMVRTTVRQSMNQKKTE